MERNDSQWVEETIVVLDPASEWRPDASRGLARVYARKGGTRRRWALPAAMASVGGVILLMLSASQSCAWGACLIPGNASFLPATIATPHQASFKTSGSHSAPITIEIYSDYECPYCAKYFNETLPLLVAEYVKTGKVRLIHRDFPLPQHAWAKVAARYANAAGELGQYDAAVSQIFRTQDLWRDNGNIDAQLLQVLPPGLMQKVRDMVQHDAKLDDTIAQDVRMAAEDHINQTPSLVIESKGQRQTIPAPAFAVLKSYIEQLLGK
ncbi:MAG TPA: thioredoxin domain-containing protein [Bryobacteraceae bacterium]|nr:thioredoxin domain-containing protein [Bryobacteraceae bacterium]